MRNIWYLLSSLLIAASLTVELASAPQHSLVFVHLGPSEIPKYAVTAVEQARLFNPDCPFYFIVQHKQVAPLTHRLRESHVTCIAAESLKKTPHHTRFLQTSTLDPNWHHGFWKYTTDRIFYLEEVMIDHQLSNVVHIENDIMLYVDLSTIMPTLQKHYKGIGITFGSDNMCVPGFVYIPSAASLKPITTFLADRAREGKDDGLTLATCKNTIGRHYIDHLPTVCTEYALHHEMKNLCNEKAVDPALFSQHIEEFQSIFDAAAFGQFLGGWSPLNSGWNNGQPCKNFWSMFDASHVPVTWELDCQGRKVPFANFAGTKYRINNLHIHSKNLKGFCS